MNAVMRFHGQRPAVNLIEALSGLDGVDGAVHAGAVAARGGHEDPLAALGGGGCGVGVLTGELDGRHGHHCATVGPRSPVVDVAQWCM